SVSDRVFYIYPDSNPFPNEYSFDNRILQRSSDGGKSWRAILTLKSHDVRWIVVSGDGYVKIINKNNIIVGGRSTERFIQTKDSGKTWEESGSQIMTKDGGETWEKIKEGKNKED
ncbi:MAG: hypothetical protein AABX29_07500, partial [Nanoarchaeota archaeon]